MLTSVRDMLCSDGFQRKQTEKYSHYQSLTRIQCTAFMSSYKYIIKDKIDR
jgi:hypothetical protein